VRHRLQTPALTIPLGVVSAGAAVASQQNDGDALGQVAVAVPELAFLVVGLLILDRRSRHRVGRLLVAGSLVALVGTGLTEVAVRRLESSPDEVLARLGGTLGTTGRGLGWLMIVLILPLIFPDGTREGPPRLARAAWRTCLAALAVYLPTSLLSPTISDLRVDRIDNPIGLPHALSSATDGLGALLLLLCAVGIALGVTTLVARYRRGTALRRQQLILLGASFAAPILVLSLSFSDRGGAWMFGVATLPIPIAVVVAIRQQRLYDLTLAVNRSLTYGSLWLLIALMYALIVGGVGATLRSEGAAWLPWVAAGVVAVTFAPLREALQQAANRVTYGQWADPSEVLHRTTRRLTDAGDLGELLRSLTAELSEDLRLGHVEIRNTDGTVLASAGLPTHPTDTLPLTAYGEPVGTLSWGRRRLRAADRSLLSDLATHLGVVIHARLAQERLVLAREEERRRLRRDLHDGLGPALAGLTLQVDVVRNSPGPAAEAELLRLRSGIQQTVVDVRRIVEGLRPAPLDDLGLVESVHQLAARVGVPVSVDGEDLRLPAAVEVAAFRIIQEALTNVSKHSGAGTACVAWCVLDGALELRVSDDGCGGVRPHPDGVGLNSMRERAEEIGGRLDIRSEQGTTVTAVLPLGGVASC
jgi:signal transduction histidine kinase